MWCHCHPPHTNVKSPSSNLLRLFQLQNMKRAICAHIGTHVQNGKSGCGVVWYEYIPVVATKLGMNKSSKSKIIKKHTGVFLSLRNPPGKAKMLGPSSSARRGISWSFLRGWLGWVVLENNSNSKKSQQQEKAQERIIRFPPVRTPIIVSKKLSRSVSIKGCGW